MVVTFGTYDARRHPRVTVLVDGLRARGAGVTECNVPLDVGTAARVEALRRPWKLVPLAVRAAATWIRLWRRAREVPAADVVLVGYLGVFDVHLARLLWPRATIILDQLAFVGGIARDRGLGGSVLRRVLDRVDRVAMGRADVVVVDTTEHLGLMPEALRPRGVVVPVGAAGAWFAAAGRDRQDTGRLRVVFFGVYTPLHGAPTVGEAIARCGPDVTFTMIGHGQELDATRVAVGGNPRVEWLDWVEAERLPEVVAAHDVCLGIFGTGAKAQRVVPTKVYQGAAAGCAIVTGDTAPQRRALGDAALFVSCGDAMALATALGGLAGDARALAEMRSRARRLAEREFHPGAVVAPLLRHLEADSG